MGEHAGRSQLTMRGQNAAAPVKRSGGAISGRDSSGAAPDADIGSDAAECDDLRD